MMKWLIVILALLLTFCGAAGETRLMVVSDIHHLSGSLRDDSDFFLQVLRTGDGKLTQRGDELLDALEIEIERQRPDALLVTGDLAFNGERQSHLTLAKRFSEIEALGVPVWVLPGNHDINVPSPRGYCAEGWYPAEGVTEEEFAEVYADFLGPTTKTAGFSYAVPVGESLWVAMTDVAFYQGVAQTFGIFMAQHAQWLEAALQKAREDGAEVITASHHNLIAHTDFMQDSYLMMGSESMAALDRRYGVRLHLSGHLHVQSIVREDGLADAALGAFCAWPHRYAMVVLKDDGELVYEAKALGDSLPRDLQKMSREWYLDVSRRKTRATLTDCGLTETEMDAMAEYAARFNLAYFSGTLDSGDAFWREDPGYALWKSLGEHPYWQYMEQVLDAPPGDDLRLMLTGDG